MSPPAERIWGYLYDLVVIGDHFDIDPGLASNLSLMEIAHLTQADSLAEYISELVDIGAIDIDEPDGPEYGNSYRVNMSPPDNYDGPMSTLEWIRSQRIGKNAGQAKSTADRRRTP